MIRVSVDALHLVAVVVVVVSTVLINTIVAILVAIVTTIVVVVVDVGSIVKPGSRRYAIQNNSLAAKPTRRRRGEDCRTQRYQQRQR